MNTNFSKWLADKKLKESNLGSLSPAGFDDIYGQEREEAGVKKPGYRYTPIDQVPAPEQDLDAMMDDPAQQHPSNSDTMGHHGAPNYDPSNGYDPENIHDNPAGIPENPLDNMPLHQRDTAAASPYQNDPSSHAPLRNFLHPQSPAVAGGFDAQTALERPLSKKERSARLLDKLKKAKRSWKDYKQARKAQSHEMGGTPMGGQPSVIDPRAAGAEFRRFGGY